MVIKHLRPN